MNCPKAQQKLQKRKIANISMLHNNKPPRIRGRKTKLYLISQIMINQ